jgi:hypothetical protein
MAGEISKSHVNSISTLGRIKFSTVCLRGVIARPTNLCVLGSSMFFQDKERKRRRTDVYIGVIEYQSVESKRWKILLSRFVWRSVPLFAGQFIRQFCGVLSRFSMFVFFGRVNSAGEKLPISFFHFFAPLRIYYFAYAIYIDVR